MKNALILEGRDSLGRPVVTRYGVKDELKVLESSIQELLAEKKVEFVVITGSCYVRNFHGENRETF